MIFRQTYITTFAKSIIFIMLLVSLHNPTTIYAQQDDDHPIAEFVDESVAEADILSQEAEAVEWRLPSDEKLEDYRKDKRFRYKPREVEKVNTNSSPSWFNEFINTIFGVLAGLFVLESELNILGWILVLVVAIVIVLLLAKVFKFDIKSFVRKKKKIEEGEQEAEGDVHNMGFDSLIANAVRDGDFRLAIRYLYLQNLKLMSDKSIIDWRQNKTNNSYLREITNQHIQSKFRQTTNIFDYVWYGEFPVDAQGYETIKKHMYELKNLIGV